MVKNLITLPHNFTEDNANGDTVNFTGIDLDDNFNACKTEIERLDAIVNDRLTNATSKNNVIVRTINLDDLDDNQYSCRSSYYSLTGKSYPLINGLTVSCRLTLDKNFQPKAKPYLKLDANEYKPIIYHNQTSLSSGTSEPIYYIDGNTFATGVNTFTYNEAFDCWVYKGCLPSGKIFANVYPKIAATLLTGFIGLQFPTNKIDPDYLDQHPYFARWYDDTIEKSNITVQGSSNIVGNIDSVGDLYASEKGQTGVYGSFETKTDTSDNDNYMNSPTNKITLSRSGDIYPWFNEPYILHYTNITLAQVKITYTPPTPTLQAVSNTAGKFITKRFCVTWNMKT